MTDDNKEGRRGCYFYGCGIAVVLLLLVVIGGIVGLRMTKRMLVNFTDEAPIAVRTVHLVPGQAERVRAKVDRFREEIQRGQASAPLAMTGEEINTLIASDPALKALREKVYVVVEGGVLKSDLSVPLEHLGLDVFKGRYLNGTATFDAALRNGNVLLTVREIRVKGNKIPGIYLEAIRRQNLARDLNASAERSLLQNLDGLRVEGDRVLVMPKSR